MAELQDHSDQSTCGIKLFGATIAIEERKSRNDEDKSQETLEKRQGLDKIIPCPRCKSMETKFCYFNNYNVNQPRHFCKGCQRYWTAGGALRNVPVGAGRRKSKPTFHGLDGLSDGCMFDCVTHDQVQVQVQQLELDNGVVEEWHGAEHGGLRDVFPAKRRRNGTISSQPC